MASFASSATTSGARKHGPINCVCYVIQLRCWERETVQNIFFTTSWMSLLPADDRVKHLYLGHSRFLHKNGNNVLNLSSKIVEISQLIIETGTRIYCGSEYTPKLSQ